MHANVRAGVALVLGSASYGFAIGWVHSPVFALRNLVKLPLLLVVTGAVCSLAFYLSARAFAPSLGFFAIVRTAVGMYCHTAMLLGALAPPMLFLSSVLERPDARGLNEYVWFLGANVVAIAVCGSTTLAVESRRLFEEHGLTRSQTTVLVAAWLFLSLLVGAQWSWYLRPFCGVATVDAPFVLGTEPDFRGATSFYEAVYHLIDPPSSP